MDIFLESIWKLKIDKMYGLHSNIPPVVCRCSMQRWEYYTWYWSHFPEQSSRLSVEHMNAFHLLAWSETILGVKSSEKWIHELLSGPLGSFPEEISGIDCQLNRHKVEADARFMYAEQPRHHGFYPMTTSDCLVKKQRLLSRLVMECSVQFGSLDIFSEPQNRTIRSVRPFLQNHKLNLWTSLALRTSVIFTIQY